MENDLTGTLHAKEWILDKFTGRENNDREPDPKMTIVDRVDRFLAAEYELGRAERALELGYNKYEYDGEHEDIESAIVILKASAEYHASRVDEQELSQAVASEDVREEEAAALMYRKEQMASKPRGIEMREEYFEDLEERMEQDAKESGEDRAQNQDNDDGQTR